ncbi:unnamed protein product [Allacma fusca]|uniref:Lipoprotein n=1 Tax=Allacma fusca TaxID=39272 RepID=A0A8J2NZ04_9HEXA|nr:unnamed protein product [Allacma fusca]
MKLPRDLVEFYGLIAILVTVTSCAKRELIESKQTIFVDSQNDLRVSACNSGTWFQYANFTRNLSNAPQLVKDNFKDSFGIWFLQGNPFTSVTFDNQFPCMEYASSALLYSKIEITYYFKSSSSNFSVFDYSREKLLAFVNNTSTQHKDSKTLDWDTLTIEQESAKTIHGFVLTANITADDYLLIEKISGYPLSANRMEV